MTDAERQRRRREKLVNLNPSAQWFKAMEQVTEGLWAMVRLMQARGLDADAKEFLDLDDQFKNIEAEAYAHMYPEEAAELERSNNEDLAERLVVDGERLSQPSTAR